MSGPALSGESSSLTSLLTFKISYVDRNTLANASILGYKTSLNLASDQYNIISTAFYFSYSVFEIPSQIIIQRVR
jgi:nitrogenase molybdenum-iron protein alpha/beta subunit